MLPPQHIPDLHGKKRLNALTSLRILAAIHVVLFHCARPIFDQTFANWVDLTRHSSPPVRLAVLILGRGISNFLSAGPWSVSLFFILSGFILFYNYGNSSSRSVTAGKFWIARFARIYPVYLLGLLMIAPFVLHDWYASEMYGLHHTIVGGVLAVSLLQSWFPKYATFWNGPGWSMSVEAFFYALFPLLMLPLRRVNGAGKLVGIILACWVVSIVKTPLIWKIALHWWAWTHARFHTSLVTAVTDYAPLSRLPEFVAGMALGRLMLLRGGPVLRGPKLAMLTIAAAGTCLILAALGNHCPWYFAAAGGLTPLFALVIWSLTIEDSFVAKLLAWSPLVFLGEVSYSIYIIHLPLAHWFGVAVNHITHRPDSETFLDIPNYLVLAIFIPVLLGVCSLIYTFFEMPARDFIRDRFTRRSAEQPMTIEASVSPSPT